MRPFRNRAPPSTRRSMPDRRSQSPQPRLRHLFGQSGNLRPYCRELGDKTSVGPRSQGGCAVALMVVTTIVMLPLRESLGILNVGLIFLWLAFVLALGLGVGPAAVAAVLSFVAYDSFLIPPYHTFAVANTDHVLALFVSLGVAITTGQLVARVRERTDAAVREQHRSRMLQESNAALVGGVTIDAILGTIVEQVVHVYGSAGCRILMPDSDGILPVRAGFPADAEVKIDR